MKKYLLVLFLIAFIIPSVALASWWNPFTWKIFNKKEVPPQIQTEVQKTPEEKIRELQKQLDELKNKQPNSDTTKTSNKPVSQVVNEKFSDLTDSETWKQYSVRFKKNIIIPNYAERIERAKSLCNYIELDYKVSLPYFKKYPYCSDGQDADGTIHKSYLVTIENSRNSKENTLKAWESVLYEEGVIAYLKNDQNNKFSKPPSWEELEVKYFPVGTSKGWPSIIITNDVGEKRYYRDEDGVWVQKNTLERANQPYVKNLPSATPEHLALVYKFCGIHPERCKSTFWDGYNTNSNFRNTMDILIGEYFALPTYSTNITSPYYPSYETFPTYVPPPIQAAPHTIICHSTYSNATGTTTYCN